mgnify:CR=1 FL=1
MKEPRIDSDQKKTLMTHLLHMGYIKGVPGKWILTMKGQQILIILNELKTTGHIEKIDARFMRKSGAEKLGEFLIDIVSKK